MTKLVGILDVPASDQLTRVRLVIQDGNEFRVSGPEKPHTLSAPEVEQLNEHGLVLYVDQAQSDRRGGLENPFGFWMGATVDAKNRSLPERARFPTPQRVIPIDQPPCNGFLWLETREKIEQKRDAWLELLAHYAMNGGDRKLVLSLLIATRPAHPLTQAVALHTMTEEEGTSWLQRQLAAEGLRPDATQTASTYRDLRTRAEEFAGRSSPLRPRLVLFEGEPALRTPTLFRNPNAEAA